jgi:competence protein ComEC
MKRPLGLVTLSYAGGLVLGEFFQPSLFLLFVVGLALVGAALASVRLRPLLIWPLVVLTGWINLVRQTTVISPGDLRAIQGEAAALATVRGTLIETPERRMLNRDGPTSFRTLAQLQINELQQGATWRPADGRIVVSTDGILPDSFRAHQRVEICGVLAPPRGPAAEGLFDYRTWLQRQGIYYELQAGSSNDWNLVAIVNRPLLSDPFREWARGALARGLPGEDEALRLEWALSLGDKTVLTEPVTEPFVRAATFHIFAVDGLRLAILFGIFFTLFRSLRLPRFVCGLLLIPMIWFYTALTGWPASAIRAGVMLTIVILGWTLKRPGDLINSLFAAALIILLGDPQQLFQAGFQLSFVVVGCMVLTLPCFDRIARWLLQPDPFLPEELVPRWQKFLRMTGRYGLDLGFTSLAAWLGSIPLAAYYFHILTPISTPANFLAVPLCALVLASNFISLTLAGLCPMVAELFNHAGWFFMEAIRVTSVWFAARPGAFIYVPAPGGLTIALYYIVLLGLATGRLLAPRWRRGKLAVAIILLLFWTVLQLRERASVRLTILPLSGGSAVYCDDAGRRNDLLIDCGSRHAVEFIVNPFLRAQGVNRVSCLVLTEGNARRTGGAELLESLLPVDRIAISPARFRSPAYRRLLAAQPNDPRGRRVLNCGDELNGWTVLHPAADDQFSQADDQAMVLIRDIHGVRILLLSDLGRAGQEVLLNRGRNLRADIVVAGLPEKSEPLNDALLDAIHPQLIMITDSEFPAGRRAHAPLCERLAQRGVAVVYTREAGAATLSLQRGRWDLRTVNGVHLTGVSGRDP